MIFDTFSSDQLQRIAAATAHLYGEDWDAPEAAEARAATEGEQWDFSTWRAVYDAALEQLASRSMSGMDAIAYAQQHGLLLAKGARGGLTPAQARAVVAEDQALVHLDPATIISSETVLADAGRCVVCGALATHVCAGCGDTRCDAHEMRGCQDVDPRTQRAAQEESQRLELPLR